MVSTSDLISTVEISPNLVYSKVCLAGDGGVGKTSLFLRLATGDFVETTQTTLKIDVHRLTHVVNGIEVPIVINDTCGYEKVCTLSPNYFRGALVVILVFSIEEKNTLHQLEILVEEAQKFTHKDCFYVLVGNKTDLLMDFEESDVEEFKESLGCKNVFFTSAKTGEGIKEMMDGISLYLHDCTFSCEKTRSGTVLLEPFVRKTEKRKSFC